MSAPRLERYDILDELGQGGMSVVYRARDKQLGRNVAVKVLHQFLAKQEEARRRFHREAVAVARLQHPGILEIFDYSGAEVEAAYIVTELIEGQTLRAFLDTHGRLRFPELGALILAELCRALKHAHEQGVIHRDIKPENIMIARDGQLKLMDFGIAQIVGGSTRLTATGSMLGSPAHMAPEVIDGQPSDHRSDIFSLGTILFWLTTGALPFAAPNPSALFRQILESRYEPPQALEPKIGNGLARIIERALASRPEDRYQGVAGLESDLLRELESVALVPPETIARRLLLDPHGFSADLEPRLVGALTRTGKAALAERQIGRAMDAFNRVLAIEPKHPEVARLVLQLGRRERLSRGIKRTAFVAATLGALGAAGTWAAEWVRPSLQSHEPHEAPMRAEVPPVEAARPAPTDGAPAARGLETRSPAPPARSPARDAAPGPRSTPPARAAAPEVEVPERTLGRLTVRIGHGWADIRVNGELRYTSAYVETLELEPGQHSIEVVKPSLGRYLPRVVEVDRDGRVFEVSSGKRRQLGDGTLMFPLPRNPEEASSLEGWTSS